MASMDALLLFVLIAIITCCIMFTKRFWDESEKHSGDLLPGPRSWPIIGNSFQIDFKRLHVSVTDMVKKHGAIFRIRLMGQTAVVISDPDILRKAYGSEQYGNVFNDRPDSFYGKYVGFDCSGIGFAKADNKATTIKRRMFHRAFKFYGDGIDHFERNAEDEIIIIIIIIISLFNEDDILSYRLSNIWSSTMKLVQICLKPYIQYNKYTLFTF